MQARLSLPAALSGLLPSTLHAGLSPQAVEIGLADWRGRWQRREHHAVPNGGWRGALTVLREQLRAGQWRAGAMELVLSTHFVRHCLLPFDAGIRRAAEQAGYVKHLFRTEYGDEVAGWNIAVDRAGSGARLACAIDGALIEEASVLCREHNMRLRSVRPHLVEAANRSCRRVQRPQAWLAVLEPDVCALALLDAGNWRHVARARLGASGTGSDLFGVLRQQSLLLPREQGARTVYICGNTGALDLAQADGQWDVEVISRAAGNATGLLPS